MRKLLPLILAVGTLTACGSTAPQSGLAGPQSAAGQSQNGLGQAAGSGPAGALGSGAAGSGAAGPGAAIPGSGKVPGSGALAPAAGLPGSSGAGGRTTSTSSGGGQGAPINATGAQAPGVTATTINVGLPYGTNGKAAGAAFGATGPGVGGGDGRQIWNVALKLVNDSGPIFGRKLVPVFHPIDSTSSETQASIEQEECTDFTQDHKVFWAAVSSAKTATPCLEKAGVSQSTSNPTDAGTAFYRQYPNYIEAGTLQMDRVAAAMPPLLQQQGWLGKWDTANDQPGGVAPVKFGIVSFDDSYTQHAVKDILVPALKKALPGASPVVIFVQTPQSAADNGSAITAMQNATLRFRKEGVTHVIPFETQGAGIGVFVSQGADKQNYFPRYGVSSGNAVQLYIDQGLWPKTQVKGILGVGWSPFLDLSSSGNADNGPYANASRRSCVAAMQKAGIDVSAPIVKRQAVEYCTNLRFLKAALVAGGSSISPASFRAGAERLGSSFESGLTFGTRYDGAHHDGVSLVRALAYQESCGCVQYGTSLLSVG